MKNKKEKIADIRKQLRLIDKLLELTDNKLLIKELKGERGNLENLLDYPELL